MLGMEASSIHYSLLFQKHQSRKVLAGGNLNTFTKLKNLVAKTWIEIEF